MHPLLSWLWSSPPKPQGPSAGVALINLADAWLAQGVHEVDGSNAGPDVSWLIHDGGGNPDVKPPWCAYFVSSLCRQLERAGYGMRYKRTGRAVSHWQSAKGSDRIAPQDVWTQRPGGLLMVRTRLSKDVSDAQKARDGMARQGHVAIVTGINEAERTIELIAGNSSGAGHSSVPGSGSVARERILEGDRAWQRLVGFVRVCDS